jgi:small subunit ribosomal protein S3
MGQKVNPVGLRVGIIHDWDSKWYLRKEDYVDALHEDLIIRKYIDKNLQNAEVGKVEIVRYPERITVFLHTAKPGIVIGAKGRDVEKLKAELQKLTSRKLLLNIVEVKQPELSAQLIANNIARQLKTRVSYKKVMKQAISLAMRSGAKGVKIRVAGRLAGSEMARSERYSEGRIPLHTLRADIDYAMGRSYTTFGVIGVKVWVFKGLVFEKRGTGVLNTSETPKQDKSKGFKKKKRQG